MMDAGNAMLEIVEMVVDERLWAMFNESEVLTQDGDDTPVRV